MSQTSPKNPASANYQSIFDNALQDYKKKAKEDLLSNPLFHKLESCGSPDDTITILRQQIPVPGLDHSASGSSDDRLTRWLDPTVKVINAFSATVGCVAAPAYPLGWAIFTGIGILLSAANAVSSSQGELLDLFGRLENVFERLEIYIEIPPTTGMTDAMFKVMVDVLCILAIATKEVKQSRSKQYVKKLIGKSDVDDALQRLENAIEVVRMATAEVYKAVHRVGDDIENEVDGINGQLMSNECHDPPRTPEQQLEAATNWLSPPDPSLNLDIACKIRYEGTTTWFIKSTTFKDWKQSGSLFWIHGIPGSGKSVVTSAIIEDIKSISETRLAHMAYFFFDFRDSRKQDSRAFLSSILVQFSHQSVLFCNILLEFYSVHQRGGLQPTDTALIQCLEKMLKGPTERPIYVILDALDECPAFPGSPSRREEILELIELLVRFQLPNLRLCITSRPEIDVRNVLEPLTSTSNRISLHEEDGQKEDIAYYIRSVVYSDNPMKRWREEDKKLVIETLSTRANGIFRWVSCQIDYLRRCLPGRLLQALDELPETLDKTYEQILWEIANKNREHGQWLLQCLMAATRPLRVQELGEVLAAIFDPTKGIAGLKEEWSLEDLERVMLSWCPSLIQVVGYRDSQVVQLSHFSVKQFLASDPFAASTVDSLRHHHLRLEPAHAIVAQTCIRALLCLDDQIDETKTQNIPLTSYAANLCVNDAQMGYISSYIQDEIECLFDKDKPQFAAWIQLHDIDNPSSEPTSHPKVSEATPLYYSALCGFRGIAERLVHSRPQDVQARGGRYVTPLHAASDKGHAKVALLLLEHGADVRSRGIYHHTPLHLSSHHGHVDMVQLLINWGADPNAENVRQETPLVVTSNNGSLKTARMLLAHGADANRPDSSGWTPLHVASLNGHGDIVKLLLDHAANANAENDIGDTPLHVASFRGETEVAKILLKNGANLDARDIQGGTALHDAAQSGNPDVVRLLLDQGADMNAQDEDSWTALHVAACCGHVQVGKVLLTRGARWYSENNGGNTPYQIALESDHSEMIHLLSKRW